MQDLTTLEVAEHQPYIHRLTRLGAAGANRRPLAAFVHAIAPVLWDGTVDGWNEGDHLARAAAAAGFDLAAMDKAIEADPDRFEAVIAGNEKDHAASGHWGVPTFVFEKRTVLRPGPHRSPDLAHGKQGADPQEVMLTASRRPAVPKSRRNEKHRGNAMAHETATLAGYVADLKFEDIPPEVLERAKVLTLDFLGSAIRARRDAESTPSLLKMLEALALDGKGEATVFGDTKTWTPAVAALLNGALGHSLDFDDTHADSSLHPSAPVVPAAFAVGEMVGASGRDVLTAIVAGYEVCCRLGNALDPTSHYARGFHPTATAGTYGAAAAAAKLFGLSQQQIIAAFGVSGSQAAGSLQFLRQRRLEQALSGRRRRHERRDRRHAGAQRFCRLDRSRSRASTACSSATATTPIRTRRSPASARPTRP